MTQTADTEQKERPILFSAAMVRAILDGPKTQTRRVMKPQPTTFAHAHPAVQSEVIRAHERKHRCPYGQPGDRLWVREAHAIVPRTAYAHSDGVVQALRPDDNHDAAVYREGWERSAPGRWRPSIHMPRWASRITLEITDVRVQRLQEVSENDAMAEGVQLGAAPEDYTGDDVLDSDCGYFTPRSCREGFRSLWNTLNAERGYGWDVNPWVWALTFKRVEASHV